MELDNSTVKLGAGALTVLILLGIVLTFVGGPLQLIGFMFILTGFLGNAGLLAYSVSQGTISLGASKPEPSGHRQQDIENVKRSVQGEKPAAPDDSRQEAGPATQGSKQSPSTPTPPASGTTSGQGQRESREQDSQDQLTPPTGGSNRKAEQKRQEKDMDRMQQLQNEVSRISDVIQQQDRLANEQQLLNRLDDAINALEQDNLDTAEQAINDMRQMLER